MDDLNCSGEEVFQTLRELDTINNLLGGNRVTLNALASLMESTRPVPTSIVDVGCGSGEALRLIRRWSRSKGIYLTLTGVDANPFIIEYARRKTPLEDYINYEVADILSPDFAPERFDVIFGTLFFHHFTDHQLIEFLKRARTAGAAVIINDIHRHPLAWYSIAWLTRMFSKSKMVRNDAPVSVLRAFKKKELREILAQAGFVDYTVRWMWAFRWQVIAKV